MTILIAFNDVGGGRNTMKAAPKINNATLTHLEALVNLLSIFNFAQQQTEYCGKGWWKVTAICNVQCLLCDRQERDRFLRSSKLSIAERVEEKWLLSAMFALWQAQDKDPMVLSIHPSLKNTMRHRHRDQRHCESKCFSFLERECNGVSVRVPTYFYTGITKRDKLQ